MFESSSDFSLSCVHFATLGEASIRGLVQHKVLRLDQNQVAKEGREEQGTHHRDNQGKVEHYLGHQRVCLHNHWQQACLLGRIEGVLSDFHVDI